MLLYRALSSFYVLCSILLQRMNSKVSSLRNLLKIEHADRTVFFDGMSKAHKISLLKK